MNIFEVRNKCDEAMNWVYWYGAKHQTTSKWLATQLKFGEYTKKVWTDAYYNKAIKDISPTRIACDCSGFVCWFYGIPQIGSSQIKAKFHTIDIKKAKAGMIAWKNGHVGILYDDATPENNYDPRIAEMRGIDYDYCNYRTFSWCGFTHVLYVDGVDYNAPEKQDGEKYGHLGWERDDYGWWYIFGYNKGEYFKNGIHEIDGHLYYFDGEGYAYERCK